MIEAARKRKIEWRCRRGMLELDLLLNNFFAHGLEKLTAQQLDVFERLLSAHDPDLYSWLMATSCPTDREFLHLVEFIKQQHRI